MRWSLSEHARYPNITNLDAHYVIPKEGIWQLYCRTSSSQLDVPKDQQVVVKPLWCNGKIQAEPPSPSLPSPMEHVSVYHYCAARDRSHLFPTQQPSLHMLPLWNSSLSCAGRISGGSIIGEPSNTTLAWEE